MFVSTKPNLPEIQISYACVKGLFFLRIERTFMPYGQTETIMYIPRWASEANEMAAKTVHYLNIVESLKT